MATASVTTRSVRTGPVTTTPVYVITKEGLQVLIGKEGDNIRAKIKEQDNPLDFQFYDDENHTWAPWVVKNSDDGIRPLKFMNPEAYGITSAELYAKTVTFPMVVAQIIEIITRKAQTLWDRLMKPTTVIGAIVLIVLIMIIGVVALQG